jgi:hypothetical protein
MVVISVSAMSSWLYVIAFTTISAAYKPLSDSFLRAIPSPSDALDSQNGPLLAPLLIPRVPGTPGHTSVQYHIASYFERELPTWSISWQNSSSITPLSSTVEIPFANFIAKREPPWTKLGEANLLTLVAHYDSKYAPKGFVGATDSAVPVAILMWVAKVVDEHVSRMYREMSELGEGGTVAMDMGIQILFLDGEEAFEKWSDTDSLYGARYVYKNISFKGVMANIQIQSSRQTMVHPTQPHHLQILQISHPTLPNLPLPPPRPPRCPLPNHPLLLPHHPLGLQGPLHRRIPPPLPTTSRVLVRLPLSARRQYDDGVWCC